MGSFGFAACVVLTLQNSNCYPACAPITSGAMKRTTDGRWAHLTCALWMPELSMVDNKRMEPVDGINAIHKEHWNLTCSVYRVYHMDLAYDIQTVTAMWHIIPCVLELLASVWKP